MGALKHFVGHSQWAWLQAMLYLYCLESVNWFDMSSITINGVSYTGNNISINGNSIRIDGKDVAKKDVLQVSIVVHGNVDNLHIDSCKEIVVKGQVNNLESVSGDVTCYNVNGNVRTISGDVSCRSIAGNVMTTSGDIREIR